MEPSVIFEVLSKIFWKSKKEEKSLRNLTLKLTITVFILKYEKN
jgi:hypothetical protein